MREYGFKELYRGMIPILLRNGPSNALFFVLREEAIMRVPKGSSELSNFTHQFFCGAVIGAFVSGVFYPLNVVKIVIQSKIGGSYDNMFIVLRKIYVERGCSIKNVYKGLNMNCVRAFFSWGIMNAAYEHLKHLMY
jgi:hypothetical protein